MNQHSQWKLTRSEQVISLTLWPQNIFGSYSQLAAVKKKKENELFTSALTTSAFPKPLPQGGWSHRCQECSMEMPEASPSQAPHRGWAAPDFLQAKPPQPGSPHQAAAASTEGWELHLPGAQTPSYMTFWGCGSKHQKASGTLELWAIKNINIPRPFRHLGPFTQSGGCSLTHLWNTTVLHHTVDFTHAKTILYEILYPHSADYINQYFLFSL